MAISGVHTGAAPQSDLERLKDQQSQSLEQEKARLKKATKEFESFFMYQLLKTMRNTVDETSLAEGAPLSGDQSKEIFTDMFDMQMSQKMTTGGRNSISDILYRSLERVVEAQYSDEQGPVEIKPLNRTSAAKSIKLRQPSFKEIQRETPIAPLPGRGEQFKPISAVQKALPTDRVLAEYGEIIQTVAREHQLDPGLIISVIRAESNGDPRAESSAGAKGLMQLIDSTASDYGVRDSFDPEQNIRAGSRYLKDLINRFGTLKLALAAYNAGPTNVERYGGVPPFRETQAYVAKVLDSLSSLRTALSPNTLKGSSK